VAGADLRAIFVASCLRGALPPVDLRAVCEDDNGKSQSESNPQTDSDQYLLRSCHLVEKKDAARTTHRCSAKAPKFVSKVCLQILLATKITVAQFSVAQVATFECVVLYLMSNRWCL
jgi:hypothetical protein